jgi:hypothetical protein
MEVNLMQGWLPLREQASVLYKAQHTAQSGLRASVDVVHVNFEQAFFGKTLKKV